MARRPNFGATILERKIVFSGGGPPFGCPLIITESPERTCEDTTHYLMHNSYDLLMAICEIVHAFEHLLPTGQNRLLHKKDYSNIQPPKTFTYIEESILIIVNAKQRHLFYLLV
jgi:hypothetical protein